jgi:aryl-alcohol dehydrogenase-like predicted oxidoreductase
MERRRFGNTDLEVSLIGFGAWAIGGVATAGGSPIGWGPSDDATAVAAIARAVDVGITFLDTADFYAFGHSEDLIGRVLGNRHDVVIATKVGQRVGDDGAVVHDYSKAHIVAGCEASLRRLRRETIDFYQMHTARVAHLEAGDGVDAMESLRASGKIRYWGVSAATFAPAPEAEYLLAHRLGHGVQLVLNVVNQRARRLLPRLREAGYGVIARMPFQFGLLTGGITRDTRFPSDDHRSGRLTPTVLEQVLPILDERVWPVGAQLGLSPTALALAYCASYDEVSTIIPGIRTPQQAEVNANALNAVTAAQRAELRQHLEDDAIASVADILQRQA